MRILTHQEKAVFNAAYLSIIRVASVPAESVIDIKANGQPLPGVYIDLQHHLSGFKNIVATFCPMNENEAKQDLIDYCFKHRIQPRDFQLKGLLSIEKRKGAPVVHTYVSATEVAV